MKPHEQIECLLEYVQDIPKESWRYNAVWNEIKKLTPITDERFSTVAHKINTYKKPEEYLIKNSFRMARESRSITEYRNKVYRNRYEILKS